MAQKHKSKYKAPKDLEKSRKLTPRKDLKDYTLDDKDGGLNPKSTKEKQLNVLRKTDKETVDTGKMDVKYDADDRLYKKLEDGDYDPKTASKRFKNRLDQEEKDSKDQIKDKIENLTREQREHLVRQYIRKKIQKVISEQAKDAAATEEPATPEASATPEPEAAPAGATPPEAGATPPAGGTPPAPEAEATPPAEPTAPAGGTPPAPTTPPAGDAAKPGAEAGKESEEEEEEKLDPEAKQALDTDRFIKSIKKMTGTVEKVKAIAKVVKDATDDLEYDDSKNFYQMLRTYAINKLERLGSSDKKSKK
jgi:hypothetical protein